MYVRIGLLKAIHHLRSSDIHRKVDNGHIRWNATNNAMEDVAYGKN